jgi:hypothetical protein
MKSMTRMQSMEASCAVGSMSHLRAGKPVCGLRVMCSDAFAPLLLQLRAHLARSHYRTIRDRAMMPLSVQTQREQTLQNSLASPGKSHDRIIQAVT